MKKILIIGATSAIAEATARIYAGRKDSLYLLARNAERCQLIANDLSIRGASEVHCATFDASKADDFAAMLDTAWDTLGSIDTVLVAHGTLPDQAQCNASLETTLAEFQINATHTIALLWHLGNRFEQQGHGTIAVISSVAGDRGRQSNYLYGTAKGAISLYLQGLRNRLADKNVHVLTIKPGFVDTPMTASFDKGPLWASPEQLGEGIVKAIDKRRNVAYLPWFWQYIMLIIRHIPEFIFKKLKL